MAKIGLVTVLYKSDAVLEGFLKTLSLQIFKNYVLYIVDNSENADTDNLLNNLIKAYPVTSFKHIKTGGNVGVAAGNNVGIKAALVDNCTHLLILNNDIEIEQVDCLTKMLSIAEEKKEDIIVPKILYYDTRKIWMGGAYMDNWRALGAHYVSDDENDPRYNTVRYIDHAPTCFMLVKAGVFKNVGLMDEKYFAYYDDNDFVYRACKLGYKIYYEPALTILHKVSSSTGGDNSLFYIYYANRNKIYFIKKNYKGFRKYISLFYTLLSRTYFYMRYDKDRKQKLKQAIMDGFRMPVSIG